jgi:RNA polymerase sigma-70 factor, ECF subfamily
VPTHVRTFGDMSEFDAVPDRTGSDESDAELTARFVRDAVPLLDVLYGGARRMTRNRSDAEDLVQDTMVRALEKAHLFHHDTNLRGWLVTIMHNEHVNAVRRGFRAPFMISDDAIVELGRPETQEAPVELSEIRRAVGRLPYEQREALMLHWMAGLKYEEVAAKLDLPLGTVQSRISRARKALRVMVDTPNSSLGLANPVTVPAPSPRRSRAAVTEARL